MSEDRTQPREYDAVLGGQNSIPANAAVLGGIPGVKSRLASPAIEFLLISANDRVSSGFCREFFNDRSHII
jgi:hypothetical protein